MPVFRATASDLVARHFSFKDYNSQEGGGSVRTRGAPLAHSPLDAHAQPYMETNNLVKQRVIKMVGDLEMTKRSYLPPL